MVGLRRLHAQLGGCLVGGSVKGARWTGFFALLFIAILYTTAPAVAAFARYNLIQTVNNQPYAELPAWVGNYLEAMPRFEYEPYLRRCAELGATVLRLVPAAAVRMVKDPEVNMGHKITLKDVFVSVGWFLPMSIAVAVILILVPEIATFIPDLASAQK